jgi:hypothetical protein
MSNGNCPKCQAPLTTDLKACPSCGATLEASAPPATRSFGLGDLLTGAGCVLFGGTGLLYLIGYFDDNGNFSMGLLGIIALMVSPAVPLGVALLSLKRPHLLSLNFFYAGFVWLMKFTHVSILERSSGSMTKFIVALDFWFLLAATMIAAGAWLSCRGCCGVKK